MATVLETIQKINPNAQVSIDENDVNKITWHDGTTPISKSDILTKQAELQEEYDAQEYARKREAEYPSVQDLVVALYDTDDKAAIDSKRAEIKLKYPKP
jgi:hypothetical protein